jgi:hypothetical protein
MVDRDRRPVVQISVGGQDLILPGPAPGLTSSVARSAEGPRTRHGGGPEAAPVEPEWVRQPLAAALSLEPAETLAAFVAAIWIVAPVCGFRPVRADR